RAVKNTAATLFGLAIAGIVQAQATTTVTRTINIDYDAFGQVVRQTVEPNDPALKLVTDYVRDPTYGVVTRRSNTWRDPASNTDQTRIVETLSYDARKRFATWVANAKSQGETRG